MEGSTLGQIVHSKAGRDKGKYFIIVNIVDEDYVMIVDGDLRKIDNPKKKKIKHLVFHNMVSENILASVRENKPITNAELRKSLQSIELL
jgi:large subunit ribosomal protein L14e